jgi:AcrR family transcriptional regulator
MVKEMPGEVELPLKQRALIVASRLLRSNGYEATRLEDIAAELGVTAPALYWHFSSKSDLFYALLKQIIEEFNVAIDGAFADGPSDPESTLRRVAAAHTRIQLAGLDDAQSYTAMSFSHSQLTSWMTDEQALALRNSSRIYFERVRDVVRRGMSEGVFAEGDAAVATFAIINICEYSHLWYQNDRNRSIEQVALMHADFAASIALGALRDPSARSVR